MPDRLNFEGADTGSDVSGADYDQMGCRGRTARAQWSGRAGRHHGISGQQRQRGALWPSSAPAPQITVNVQAMDSQSFLDHRSEIARAVRDAMLNSNSINDVVNDLYMSTFPS